MFFNGAIQFYLSDAISFLSLSQIDSDIGKFLIL